MEYGAWSKTKVPVEPNKTIFSDNYYNLDMSIETVKSNGVQIRFTNMIYCTNTDMNSDSFFIEKNKTYDFVTGSVSGIEVKVRYL